jgi:hypothetical protein
MELTMFFDPYPPDETKHNHVDEDNPTVEANDRKKISIL